MTRPEDQRHPYSREEFERQRDLFRQVDREGGLVLAIVSVGLGLAQLGFQRWAGSHLDRRTMVAIAGPVFLGYLALVGILIGRHSLRRRAARPRCPSCGARLDELAVRVATASGRCDACGGQVIAHTPEA